MAEPHLRGVGLTMRIFGEFTKIEDQEDGSIKVFGIASSGARDDAGEIVKPEAMKAALPDYARYPALREMHQPSAAGTMLEADVDAQGFTRVVGHVVDPVAITKVKSGTYRGFSIGGRVLERDSADRTIITAIKLSEISLVDRPANPEASIDLWKADIGDHTPMAYAPTNDEVKARAAEMAKAAGKTAMDAFKGYVAKAREALLAQHVETPAVATPAVDPALAEAVDKAASGLSPEDRGAVLAKVSAAVEAGEDVDDAVTKAIAEHQAARETPAEPDAAAILAAAIAKAKEGDAPAVAPPALDLAKTAAALRLMLAASEDKLVKGLWSVARLAEIIEALTWLQQDVTWEAAGEGDGSGVPASIAENIGALLTCLQAMVAEEAAEIVEAYQEQGMDIDLDVEGGDAIILEAASSIIDLAKADEALMAKVGARNSKADAANIQTAHDATAKLGAMCDPSNCPADDAGKTTATADLAKLSTEAAELLTKQSGEIAELKIAAAGEADRTAAAIEGALAKFRKEPLPPKTAASTHVRIGKAEDVSPGAEAPEADDIAKLDKWWASLTPEQRTVESMKAAFRSPVQAR